MRKILFMDLDDTLLDSEKNVSPENEAAINEALSQGHVIAICTGRPLSGTFGTIRRLNLDRENCYAVCFNGGVIYDSYRKEVLFKKSFPIADAQKVFAAADKAGIHVQTYDSEALLVREYNREADYYVKHCPTPYKVDPDLPATLSEDPVKCLLIDLEGRDKTEPFRQSFSANVKTDVPLSLFYSSGLYLEVVREGISKGEAIRWLCGHLGIPVENSVGAGDSENDLPMIKAAGVGCAMANACQACKDAADYVTARDCNHSGLAEIVHRFILDDAAD